MCLNTSRWDCYNGFVASVDMLPNFLCYETGPVEPVLSLKETMASYRWNVDPPNQKDFTVLERAGRELTTRSHGEY